MNVFVFGVGVSCACAATGSGVNVGVGVNVGTGVGIGGAGGGVGLDLAITTGAVFSTGLSGAQPTKAKTQASKSNFFMRAIMTQKREDGRNRPYSQKELLP